jgi:transposase
MPRRAVVAGHQSLEDLDARYRATRDPVERAHWQVVRLVAGGRTCREVAAIVGYSLTWVRTIIRRYNAAGPAGIGDRRHANPGGTGLLTPAQQAELRAALSASPPDGGLWTCQKVADWIAVRLGRPIAEQRGWDYLCRLGFSPQRPRPREVRADPAAQTAFVKGGSEASSTPSSGRIPPRP